MSRPHASPDVSSFDWRQLWITVVEGRWIVLGVLFATLCLGAAATWLTPRLYTAEAVLEIDDDAQKIEPVGVSLPISTRFPSDEFLRTEYGLLNGRAVAARVVRDLRLDEDRAFLDELRLPAGDHRPDAIIRRLRQNMRMAPQSGSRLVEIHYTSADPDLSARIANGFAAALIAISTERRQHSSAYARDYLGGELTAAKAKLEASESGLALYAAEHGIVPLPGPDGANGPEAGRSLTAASLEVLNTALATATADRIEAEQHWRQDQSAGPASPEVLQSATVQQVIEDRAKLAADYQDRLSVFKPDYPDMLQLKARMNETDRQLEREAWAILASLHTRYLTALGAEHALATQVSTLKSALLQLQSRSIRYTILKRDVDINRALYDGLLQRFRDVGVAGGVVPDNIWVINAAGAPDLPVWPRPWLSMGASILVGLVLGVMAATSAAIPRTSPKVTSGAAPGAKSASILDSQGRGHDGERNLSLATDDPSDS